MKELLIIYDSISGNTERMTKFISKGAEKKGIHIIVKKVESIVENDLKAADIIAIGCPTYNRGLTSDMKYFFETQIVNTKKDLKGKVGVAFGAYGWSGEAIKIITDNMKYLKMKVLPLPQDFTGTPDEDFYITSLSDIKEKSIKFGEDTIKKAKFSKK